MLINTGVPMLCKAISICKFDNQNLARFHFNYQLGFQHLKNFTDGYKRNEYRRAKPKRG